MSYRPYPDAHRAACQLARHAAPRLLTKFELQEAQRVHAAGRAIQSMVDALRQVRLGKSATAQS